MKSITFNRNMLILSNLGSIILCTLSHSHFFYFIITYSLLSCTSFPHLLAGYLPVQLQVTDIDEQNTTNSQITVSVLSQTPEEPKIAVERIDGRLAQLKFTGCFDYDVSLNGLLYLHHVSSHTVMWI